MSRMTVGECTYSGCPPMSPLLEVAYAEVLRKQVWSQRCSTEARRKRRLLGVLPGALPRTPSGAAPASQADRLPAWLVRFCILRLLPAMECKGLAG